MQYLFGIFGTSTKSTKNEPPDQFIYYRNTLTNIRNMGTLYKPNMGLDNLDFVKTQVPRWLFGDKSVTFHLRSHIGWRKQKCHIGFLESSASYWICRNRMATLTLGNKTVTLHLGRRHWRTGFIQMAVSHWICGNKSAASDLWKHKCYTGCVLAWKEVASWT